MAYRYTVSNPYYHVPLPSVGPHYTYAQYPAYSYPAAGYVPASPRRGYRNAYYNPPAVKINPLLQYHGSENTGMLIWDVSDSWQKGKRVSASAGQIVAMTESHYNQPATKPAIPTMWIVSRDFGYRFKVNGDRYQGVNVGQILQAIYYGLKEALDEEEWLDKDEDERTLIHESRCTRLKKENAKYEIDPQIRRIDTLHDKTVFLGLVPVGPPGAHEWELKLGFPKKKDNKERKERGQRRVVIL